MNHAENLSGEPPASRNVGVLGLGIMGGAIAGHLLAAGFRVVGFDPESARLDALERRGGQRARSPAHVAERCDVLLSLLPSAAALQAVMSGPDGILSGARSGLTLIEASTLSLETKQAALETAGAALTLLDCPLSGTGAQAVNRDLVVYASGDAQAVQRCEPVFLAFARTLHYAGPFGHGSKMKFVANLLVAIHNVAAAEAFVLGMKAGLEPQSIYELIRSGAGGSTMFTVRGPLMVAGEYEPATMKVDTWQKDMQIIQQFAADLDCPTPLLTAVAPLYLAAKAQGRGDQDTASVCAVLEAMAYHTRAS